MSTKPYPFPNPTSKEFEAAKRFLTAANEWDYETITSLLSPNFTSQAWPSSLRTSTDPITAEEYITRSRAAQENLFVSMGFDLTNLVNVLEAKDGAVMLQLNSISQLKTGETWAQEWLQIFRFDGEGKIVRHEEWQDAGRMGELYEKAGKAGPEA